MQYAAIRGCILKMGSCCLITSKLTTSTVVCQLLRTTAKHLVHFLIWGDTTVTVTTVTLARVAGLCDTHRC